ncbi:DUF5694 domain-containing protein [Nonlabens ponticola]|uniref:TraB/GumN family protein n=1 Tax=Nonlabens ponticola TaxID=2496866 RepID=A0A3S9MV99_9FLAO|nr:DUF5694 domain-containing protein [Nonlabens ponticola]AZQ43097.1 hypothetical protein EJ995_02175 [Nonlabens ponticola]
MKTLRLFILAILTSHLSIAQTATEAEFIQETKAAFKFNGAKTLLLGTWHMGATSDANKSRYDASKPERRAEITELALQLAQEFKPTKIIVEVRPERQAYMDSLYANYIANPTELSTYGGEVGLLAFQIARSSGATLHAIDHKMGYDYGRIGQMADSLNTQAVNKYYAQLMPLLQKAAALEQTATTKQLYRFTNSPEYISFLKHANSDLLTYVNTDGNFEGADVAADFYKRNLRMFANINRLDIQPDDRVLILQGATHIAFFQEFMRYSPVYDVVDVQEYLRD